MPFNNSVNMDSQRKDSFVALLLAAGCGGVISENKTMDANERALRSALLCCHFARNFAYYSVLRSSRLLREEGFWLTVYGNFLDVCVLEWCKLFGNRNGEYHWGKVVSDPSALKREFLRLYGVDDVSFRELWDKIKDYRDDFVAHLEEQETTVIPNVNVAYQLTAFYFTKLQTMFPSIQGESSLPTDFYKYYDLCLKQAKDVLVHAEEALTCHSARA
jgi:hypothetical protein